MTTPPARRAPLAVRRAAALFLVVLGLFCIAVPFGILAFKGDGGLFDDTRAFFGAGSAQGVPVASYVDCTGSRSGSTTRGFTSYGCVIDLVATAVPQDNPYTGRSYNDGFIEWQRRRDAQRANATSNRLERSLAIDRSGVLPTVRRLSAEGEPNRYGLVWGPGELASRWLSALFIGGLFIGIGVPLLLVARKGWQREPR